jgi:hypothetical protein
MILPILIKKKKFARLRSLKSGTAAEKQTLNSESFREQAAQRPTLNAEVAEVRLKAGVVSRSLPLGSPLAQRKKYEGRSQKGRRKN